MTSAWTFPPHDESLVRSLSASLSVSPLLARVLVARGCDTVDAATTFLGGKLSDLHDPNTLPGVPEASDAIVEAIKTERPIVIYGDYDVDGVTATSLLWHCLKLAGASVSFYIPDRQDEGYGLSESALRRLHEEQAGRLVITVDCGIGSVAEARLAAELGMDLIITDHHHVPDELPNAVALVHPRLAGSDYPFGFLCGAGVAFKLAWAICQKLGDGKKASPRMKEFLLFAVGLAAIGTVADFVPLVGENRLIVRYGLSALKDRGSVGLNTLLRVLELDQKSRIAAEDVGFSIGPRINAAGRLKQANLAVELLTTDDPNRASLLAQYLNELNRKRKTIERQTLKQAREQVRGNPAWEEQAALVLADDGWHSGIIGIVASRIASEFQKPAVLIALDRHTREGQGSGRSFADLDLHSALAHSSDILLKFGGHRAAAGLRIHESNLDALRERMHDYFTNHDDADPAPPPLPIDAEVRLADVTLRAVEELDRLGPFGCENESPLFAASDVQITEEPRRMGETQAHLSVRFGQHGTVMRAVAFGKGDWADELRDSGGRVSVAFRPKINEFRGRRNVEMQLIDWKPAAETQ